MTNVATNLLTNEDYALLDTEGMPSGVCKEYVIQANSYVTFTLRGVQFYKEALRRLGLSNSLEGIKSLVELLDLHVVMSGVRLERSRLRLKESYHQGRVPAKLRAAAAAAIDGCVAESMTYAEQAVSLRSAANVTIGRFNKKSGA